MTPLQAATLMGAVAAIAIVIDSCEMLSVRRSYAAEGAYSYDVLRTGRRYLLSGILSRPLGFLYSYPRVLALPGLQIVLGGALLVSPLLPVSSQALTVAICGSGIFAVRALFYMRQQYGLDGSDQMLLVVMLSIAATGVFEGTGIAKICIFYAALQLLLSYLVAGVAKAASHEWRTGRAIIGITGTVGYGNQRVHLFLTRYSWIAVAACWTVIIFECFSPFLVLLGPSGALVLIGLGFSFHLGIALLMGLNVFLWSFAACYPAVYLMASEFRYFLTGAT